MEEMLKEISSKTELKKSPVLAASIARDYEILSGSKAVALEGKTGRVGRNGKSMPGQYIRTNTYKISWYEFISREDALNFQDAINRSLSKREHVVMNGKTVKECTKDFGILEILVLLKERGSDLKNTAETFRILSLGLRYNV